MAVRGGRLASCINPVPSSLKQAGYLVVPIMLYLAGPDMLCFAVPAMLYLIAVMMFFVVPVMFFVVPVMLSVFSTTLEVDVSMVQGPN